MNCRNIMPLLAILAFVYGEKFANAGIAPPTIGLTARAEVVAAGAGDSEFDNTNTPAVANKVFANGGVSGEAHAIANFGSLKTSTTLTKGAAVEAFNFGTGEAIFSDELTIGGGTGPGTIVMQFHNTGTLTLPGTTGGATAHTELNVFFTDGSFQGDNRDYLVASGNASATIDDVFTTTAFNFTFGVPFSFDVKLLSEISLEETDSGTVSNDFFNTSTLQLLTVGGATGPVTITSGSGTTYPVPEPSTGLLMALVTTFCLASRRR